MAINPETQYPGKIAPSTPQYPYGAARNITVPGDGTGTPWEAALVNDLFGFQQALLSAAAIVPSGSPDQVGASQYFEALNKVAGRVFPTLADLLASTSIKIGQVVTTLGYNSIGDGGGNKYEIVAAATGTPDGGGFIDLSGITGQAKGQFPTGAVALKQFGAIGDGGSTDNTTFINNAFAFAVSSGLKRIDTGLATDLYGWVGSVSWPTGLTFSGEGVLWGAPTTGVRPDATSLRADGSSAARLVSLQAYYGCEIASPSGGIAVFGRVAVRNALITSATGENFVSRGLIEMDDCAFHGLGCKSFKDGVIDCATSLIVSDSTGVSAHAHLGGRIFSEDATVIVSAGNRAAYVQIGGIIRMPGLVAYDTTDNALFVLYGGTISASGCDIDTATGHGAVINYGGDIDVSNGSGNNCTKSTLTSESNGSIFAKGFTNTNSGDSGCSTSFGGIINMAEGSTGGHVNFDAYALGSGFINFADTVVDGTSNGGGANVMLRAIGEGTIFAEAPGTGSGKGALVSSNYNPLFNSVGNGAAYVGTYTQNDARVYTPNQSYGNSVERTISGGVITINSSYVRVDTEGNAATDDLDTINGGIDGTRLVLKAENSTRTVVVKNGVGNISLAGSDFSLDHENDTLELLYNDNGQWVELSRANNN